tara:strand:+ start:2133 stop:2579 length:447 start_codon:yes stop_codon:yes gene_type:complete
MLDKQFFDRIAPNVTARFRKIIFGSESGGKGARQVTGQPYPNYTPEYNKKKKQGTGKRQDPEFKDSNAPVFTGDTQRQFQKFKRTSNGFKFGTTRGGVVKGLEQKGRLISNDAHPLPKKVIDYILSESNKYVKTKFSKVKDIRVEIGK